MNTLQEVLGYGPIVWPSFESDEEHASFGSIITINGAYLNWWNPNAGGTWTNVECRHVGDDDLYTLTVSKAIDKAAEWATEVYTMCPECEYPRDTPWSERASGCDESCEDCGYEGKPEEAKAS